MLTAAFFDIDDTLIKGSAGGYLIRYLYREGMVRLATVLRLGYYVALYRLNRLQQTDVYRWGYGLCGDRSVAQVKQILDAAFERYVVGHVYRDALQLVDEHRARGHLVVAISGAPDYMVERICRLLGIEHHIATKTPIVGDRVSPDVEGPICYGAGKLLYATEFATRHGIDLGASYFYTDSASDLPLLEHCWQSRCRQSSALAASACGAARLAHSAFPRSRAAEPAGALKRRALNWADVRAPASLSVQIRRRGCAGADMCAA